MAKSAITLKGFGNESYLIHLRDSIPLLEKDTPKLFKPCAYTGDAAVGREYLWMILQDLFFETPGVNDILNEFFPDSWWVDRVKEEMGETK